MTSFSQAHKPVGRCEKKGCDQLGLFYVQVQTAKVRHSWWACWEHATAFERHVQQCPDCSGVMGTVVTISDGI